MRGDFNHTFERKHGTFRLDDYSSANLVQPDGMEGESYWSRIRKGDAIPPDVLAFLEAANSNKLDENPLWQEYARNHLSR